MMKFKNNLIWFAQKNSTSTKRFS